MLLLAIGFVLLPFAFMDSLVKENTKKIIILIFFTIFLVLGGIRWRTGTDWLAYQYGFEFANTYYSATEGAFSYEWGYAMLNYLINILFGSYTIFLIIFTFLKVFFKGKVFLRKEFMAYSLFSLFLYYCYMQGDILTTRQVLALSFTFFSTFFIIERKFLKFLCCIVVATLIHRTAFVFAIAYFVYNINIKQKTLIFWFIFSMIIGLVLFQFNVSSYFQHLPFLNSFTKLQEKIETYSEMGQVVYGQIDTTTTILLGYIKKIFVVLPMLLYYDVFNKNKVYRGLLNILIVGSSIYFVFGAVSADFKRLNAYFEIYEILLLPFWIYNIKQQKFKYIILFFYVIYAFVRMYSALYTFWDELDPFYTIFDKYTPRNYK